MHASLIRSLILVCGGAFLSSAISVILNPQGSSNIGIALIIISLIFILFGFSIDTIFLKTIRRFLRNKLPSIAILYDMEWGNNNNEIQTWTNITPLEWKNNIENLLTKTSIGNKKLQIKVKLITTRSNFERYSAIINPYGGVYPEQDLVNYKSLNKILEYIKERGLFINVADIPGYWAFHPILNRRVETASSIWSAFQQGNTVTLNSLKPYTNVPLLKQLGLTVSNITYTTNLTITTKLGNVSIQKVDILRTTNIENNMQVIIEIPNTNTTPMFWLKWYEGKILISMFPIDRMSMNEKQEYIKGISYLVLSEMY